MYTIGRIEWPTEEDTDEQFDDLEEAEVKAVENSYDDSVWGVRHVESGELVSLIYGQTVFRS